MTLDLHTIKHEDVTRKVDDFLWKAMQNGETSVKIITGNSTIMRDIVTQCLQEHGLSPSPYFNQFSVIFVDL
jgi:DNA-nicking Smr family endonuclease